MEVAIDTIDGGDLSNEVHCELLPMLYLLFISQQKPFNQLYITNKMERFSYKSRRAVRVAKLKRRLAYSVTVRISA